jgi:DNA-binding response OmpR family regulator
MTTDVISKVALILCDYDALYAAIELKLSNLPDVQVTRLDLAPTEPHRSQRPDGDFDLIIVATVSPTGDPLSILSKASLLGRVGEVPVLIISERPSSPESDDRITYLNFPFDMDELTYTVRGILDKHSLADA